MAVYKNSLLMAVTTNPINRAVAAQHSGGWSEQLWTDGAPFNPGNGSVWGQRRANLLPIEAQVIGMRIQAYTIVGNKLIPGGASTTPLSYPGKPIWSVNNPQSCLNLRISTAGFPNVGRYTLRCFPDELMTNGEYNGLNIAIALMAQLVNSITNGGTGFIGRNLAAVQSNCAGSDGTSMIVASTVGFAVGDQVRFIKVHDAANQSIEGVFQILAITARNKIQFVGNAGKDAIAGGKIRVDSMRFFQASAATVGRASVRKVGRPFAGFVGRRSKRRKAS